MPALATRQLPRSEVLSREDAIAAIKKEIDGIGAMGTWDLLGGRPLFMGLANNLWNLLDI